MHWRHLFVLITRAQPSQHAQFPAPEPTAAVQVKVCLTKECLVAHFLLAAVKPWMLSQVHIFPGFPQWRIVQAGLSHIPTHTLGFSRGTPGSEAEENPLKVLLVGGRSFPSVTTLGLTSLLCHMEKREVKFTARVAFCFLCRVPASTGAWGHVWGSAPAAHGEFVPVWALIAALPTGWQHLSCGSSGSAAVPGAQTAAPGCEKGRQLQSLAVPSSEGLEGPG